MSPSEHAYLGLKACGCLSMTVMEREPRAAEMVAEVIRKGGTVERVPEEAARHARVHCQAHMPPARQEALL